MDDLDVPPLPPSARLPPELGTDASPWLDEYIAFSRTWSPRSHDGFHEGSGLWLLSTIAARRVLVPYGRARYTNLYIVLAGRTTLHAKSSATEIARDTLHACHLDYLLAPDEATPQSLIRALAAVHPPPLPTGDAGGTLCSGRSRRQDPGCYPSLAGHRRLSRRADGQRHPALSVGTEPRRSQVVCRPAGPSWGTRALDGQTGRTVLSPRSGRMLGNRRGGEAERRGHGGLLLSGWGPRRTIGEKNRTFLLLSILSALRLE